jgi:hypothetical protein
MGAGIKDTEVEQQNAVFQRLWNDDFVWRFDDLPAKGGVPKTRVPYSGHIYLDKDGGTAAALRVYDRAFEETNSLPATSWEYSDTSEARRTIYYGRGLFGRASRSGQRDWYGHCNGWSAAAIRHAEPQKSVTFDGVTFSPADIKGLLAEAYMYNRHEVLAGFEERLNPGTFHAILANWIGRGSHPIVMDSDPGEEKWNYPIYSFASSSTRHSAHEIEVETNIFYAKDTPDREYDQSPRKHETRWFHYMLNLNAAGEITGGYYFNDSNMIDFVWIPLRPEQSGDEGNESGNPHLDVARVLEIWRQSVSREARRQWLIVDPFEKDRAVQVADPSRILPRRIRIVSSDTVPASVTRKEPEAGVDGEGPANTALDPPAEAAGQPAETAGDTDAESVDATEQPVESSGSAGSSAPRRRRRLRP